MSAFDKEQQAKREAGRKLDEDLDRRQQKALAEQLREEGRINAAMLVEDLIRDLTWARTRVASLEETAAKKRDRGEKDSGGRDRARASGTINAGGKAVHGANPKRVSDGGHKHNFDPDGVCRKFTPGGFVCGAKRQRQSKKSRQLPLGTATDGAKPATEATS